MKKLTYILFIIGSLFLGLSACDRENLNSGGEQPGEEKAEGQLSLNSLKLAVDIAANGSTRAAVNTDDYFIVIYDRENDNKQVIFWKYSELPEFLSLKVGSYSVAAYSHEQLPAEFENPFYYGKQEFVIEENEITEIDELQCVLQSIMVTVEYDDELAALMGTDVVAAVTIGEGTLEYKNKDSRAGYFQSMAETNILTSVFTGTVDGEEVSLSTGFANVKAGQHRIVRYTLNTTDPGGNGEDGSVGVKINIDVTCLLVEENIIVDPGEEPIIKDPNEGGGTDPGTTDPEPEPDDLPTIVGDGFDIKQSIIIPEGTDTDNPYPVSVNISASKGIKNLWLEIKSTDDEFADLINTILSERFDLAYPGTLVETLDELGLPYGNQVVDKEDLVFDITYFTGMLVVFTGEHTFQVTVIDNENNSVTENLVLIVE